MILKCRSCEECHHYHQYCRSASCRWFNDLENWVAFRSVLNSACYTMHYNDHYTQCIIIHITTHCTLLTAHRPPIANVPKSLYCNEKTSVFQLTVEPTTVNMQMVGGGTDETRCVEVPTTQHTSDPFIFSVTRRSRSDESHLLSHLLTESWLADSTDVTLVSEDTY